jgi:carboxylesterase
MHPALLRDPDNLYRRRSSPQAIMTLHNPHLDGSPFFWQNGPVGILLVHGFTATVAEVRPLAEQLHAAGYSVAGPLLPGHYSHPADLNQVSWRDWTRTVEEALQQLAAVCPTVIAGGESTGGLLTLHLAIHHPELAALLLYAPALRLTLRRRDVARMYLAAPFIPWTPKASLDSDGMWQGYPVNPLRGAIQLLRLQAQVRPRMQQIRQPVLIVQGRLDTTVHPSVPETITQQVGSSLKELHWMQNSAHCVILDRERQQVFEITRIFLEKALHT